MGRRLSARACGWKTRRSREARRRRRRRALVHKVHAHTRKQASAPRCTRACIQREIYVRFLFFVPERGNDRSIVVRLRVCECVCARIANNLCCIDDLSQAFNLRLVHRAHHISIGTIWNANISYSIVPVCVFCLFVCVCCSPLRCKTEWLHSNSRACSHARTHTVDTYWNCVT